MVNRLAPSLQNEHRPRQQAKPELNLSDMQPDTDDTRSMRERMEAGDLYIADDPELIQLAKRAHEIVDRFNSTPAHTDAERRQLLTTLFKDLGDESVILPPLRVDYGSNITIGERSFANFGLVALDVAPITIGDDVAIGPNVVAVGNPARVIRTIEADKYVR